LAFSTLSTTNTSPPDLRISPMVKFWMGVGTLPGALVSTAKYRPWKQPWQSRQRLPLPVCTGQC